MPKPTLYIHIGPHKTGTTTIQQNLDANREALAKLGYIFPATAKHTHGHHGLVGELNKSYWYIHKTSHLQALKSEIIGANKHVILSSEGFSKIEEAAPLEKLRDTFKAHFTIKIIAYLRQQDHLLPSLWKTELNFRTTEDRFDIWLDNVLKNYPNMHYDHLLGLYEKVFGKKNILPQIYIPRNPSHFSSFLEVCNISNDGGFKPVNDKNISISDYQAKLFTSLFRAELTDIDKADLTKQIESSPKLYNVLKTKIEEEQSICRHINARVREFLIRENIDQSGSIFTRAHLNKVLTAYKESNNRVSRKYFGQDTIFTHDPPSDFIERNFLRRLSKAQLIEVCNLVFITYRRREMKLAESSAA